MNFENEQKNKYEEYMAKAKEVNFFERKSSLEAAIKSLINPADDKDKEAGYPFLGSVLQCMNIQYTESLPTAGVRYNRQTKQYEMLINPYFFCRSLSHIERKAVLLHEMYHITFKHVFFDSSEDVNPMQLNYAMDLVINQYIRNLPTFCLTIDKFRTKDGVPFPPNKTTEFYYQLLNDAEAKNPNFDPNAKGQPQKGKGKPGEGQGQGEPQEGDGNGSFMSPDKEWVDVQEMFKKKEAAEFDSHEWGDGGETDAKEKMEALSDLIKRTMIKSSYSYSTIPKHVQDMMQHLDSAIKKLDYKQILQSTVRKQLPAKDTRRTWTRQSRRYGDIAPGTTVGLMPKIEVFIDTSGSMSMTEVNESLKILNNFLTVGVDKCNVSFFHTNLYHTEKFKKGFKVEQTQFHKKMQSGGTDLTQVMERINKVRPDLSIIITDGYYGDVSCDMKKTPQMVFIISAGGTTEHPLSKYGPSVKYSS